MKAQEAFHVCAIAIALDWRSSGSATPKGPGEPRSLDYTVPQSSQRLAPRQSMARPREFDVDTALDRAMHVFWAKGYESASLDDLCEATGLGRSSLYAAFGDKHALYLRALDHYEEFLAARLDDMLTRPVPVRDAIASFINWVIEDVVAGRGRRGCFIGNCAAALARDDREAANRVRRSLEHIEAAFRDALGRAKARGEIPPSADVAALARFFMAGMQGLRLIGKANPNAQSSTTLRG